MVSQFVSPDAVRLLSHLDFNFPEGIHAIGRLDNLSEGLLILTTNKKVTRLLFQGKKPHKRTYLVRVKREVPDATIALLRSGVSISTFNGAYFTTAPCEVERVLHPSIPYNGPALWPHGIHTWLNISLTEGKFHQVRKMVAAVGHRCERLIRVSIEDLGMEGLMPGEVRELGEEAFFQLLKIDDWE